jgi:hypothetical protein
MRFRSGVLFRWLVLAGLLSAAGADAQVLRGAAEVQYQNEKRVRLMGELESWLTTVRGDYSTRYRGMDVLTNVQVTERHFTGLEVRSFSPQGSIRIANPIFGAFASYRPTKATDAENITSHRDEVLLTAYFQRPGLPQLSGLWSRAQLDPGTGVPSTQGISRNVTAKYELWRLGFHADYGDQIRDPQGSEVARSRQQNGSVGTGVHFEGRRGGADARYDYTVTKRQSGFNISESTEQHSAGASGALRLTRKLSSGLSYNFIQSQGGRAGSADATNQDGSLMFMYAIARGLQASGGGGVRTAQVQSAQETESYTLVSVTADGTARPGWTVNGGGSHSVNWLPGEKGRSIDALRAATAMRLATGLFVHGEVTLSMSEAPSALAESLGTGTERTLQTNTGLRALPLRSLIVNAGVRRYRPESGVQHTQQSLNDYNAGFDWTPTAKFILHGMWSYTDNVYNAYPDQLMTRISTDLVPMRNVKASGTYVRLHQQAHGPTLILTQDRESYSAWLAASLNRDLSTRFQYDETDPGRPGHVRQVSAIVTQRFGR